MSASYTAKEGGYAYLYVSNEHPTQVDVYFDDISMSYTPSRIIQSNEYYPFGAQTARSWTRESAAPNNFLGNGGTELNLTSSLYDLDYRNYDPILGRLSQVDPLADDYGAYTPYNYSFNDPVFFNDLDGASPDCAVCDGFTYGTTTQSQWQRNFITGRPASSEYSWNPGFSGPSYIFQMLQNAIIYAMSPSGYQGSSVHDKTLWNRKSNQTGNTSFDYAGPGIDGKLFYSSDNYPQSQRAQKAYETFTEALVRMGQSDGEREYVYDNIKNGKQNFRGQYNYNNVTGEVDEDDWKISPVTDIRKALGKGDLFVHNLRDPNTNVVLNINYYWASGQQVDAHRMSNNLSPGYATGNDLFVGGPSISLVGGTRDVISFTFRSISGRDKFFKQYYMRGKTYQLKIMKLKFPQD